MRGAADMDERMNAESNSRSNDSRAGDTSSAQATDERRGPRGGRDVGLAEAY